MFIWYDCADKKIRTMSGNSLNNLNDLGAFCQRRAKAAFQEREDGLNVATFNQNVSLNPIRGAEIRHFCIFLGIDLIGDIPPDVLKTKNDVADVLVNLYQQNIETPKPPSKHNQA